VKIQSIRGTRDILPDQIQQWHYVYDILKRTSEKFGFEEYRTPIFEKTEVFQRSIGEETDIVNKEMYTFLDKGGESITLRPEMTASIVRSIIQNNLLSVHNILRIWYFGPFFRYERPQKGRLRQFHQYGAELVGSPFPEADVEIIDLAINIIKSFGITDYKLLINSLGNSQSRQNYRNALIDYFKSNIEKLSNESKQRLQINPLRILDSKDPDEQEVIVNSPSIIDYLDQESKDHFETVLELLKLSGIQFEINPQLVRGLDYYSHTVFELRSNALGSQDSFAGGGRYDELFSQMGDKPAPAVGFAMGIERLLLILEQLDLVPEFPSKIDYYVIFQDVNYLSYARKIASILRENGFNVVMELAQRSIKSQMREANKLQAKFTAIIGESEFANNTISIKNMNTGEQIVIPLNKLQDSFNK